MRGARLGAISNLQEIREMKKSDDCWFRSEEKLKKQIYYFPYRPKEDLFFKVRITADDYYHCHSVPGLRRSSLPGVIDI
jgi:hypothetical protein